MFPPRPSSPTATAPRSPPRGRHCGDRLYDRVSHPFRRPGRPAGTEQAALLSLNDMADRLSSCRLDEVITNASHNCRMKRCAIRLPCLLLSFVPGGWPICFDVRCRDRQCALNCRRLLRFQHPVRRLSMARCPGSRDPLAISFRAMYPWAAKSRRVRRLSTPRSAQASP
jgi:hypothetical protein